MPRDIAAVIVRVASRSGQWHLVYADTRTAPRVADFLLLVAVFSVTIVPRRATGQLLPAIEVDLGLAVSIGYFVALLKPVYRGAPSQLARRPPC